MKKALFAAALLIMLPAFAYAETMYITDKIEASVRSGQGLAAGSKVLGVVRTGEKVEVLATEGEYARIVQANGTEGWLHTRYLTAAPPRTAQVDSLAAEVNQLKEKNKAVQDEAVKLKEEKTGLETMLDQKVVKIKEAEVALENLKTGCTDFIRLRGDIEKAQQELRSNQEIIAQMTKENEELAQNTRLMWFIFGAVAVLCGFIIGMWLQSLRNRRKPRISF